MEVLLLFSTGYIFGNWSIFTQYNYIICPEGIKFKFQRILNSTKVEYQQLRKNWGGKGNELS